MNHRSSFKIIMLIVAFSLCMFSAGCSPAEVAEAESADTGKDLIVVGFSQVGAESDWRSANSESMKSVFTKENGYELIFEDAQQKQTNQITAIRSFFAR